MKQTTTLPELLRSARHDRRLSQLELSLAIGVSTRHLGFVEVGRSRPGRALLMRWLERLEVPLGARNEALRLAGYASAYDDSPLSGPSLTEARRALSHLLTAQDPLPAVVLNEDWDVVMSPKVPMRVRGLPMTRHRPSGVRPGSVSRLVRSHSWTSVTKYRICRPM